MTHPPSLPNGFSRDFSEAQDFVLIWYADEGDDTAIAVSIGNFRGDFFHTDIGVIPRSWALCWCHVPRPDIAAIAEVARARREARLGITPTDAVLNELAEEGK